MLGLIGVGESSVEPGGFEYELCGIWWEWIGFEGDKEKGVVSTVGMVYMASVRWCEPYSFICCLFRENSYAGRGGFFGHGRRGDGGCEGRRKEFASCSVSILSTSFNTVLNNPQ